MRDALHTFKNRCLTEYNLKNVPNFVSEWIVNEVRRADN